MNEKQIRYGLSKAQKKVFLAIKKYKSVHGSDMSPTIRELQALVGCGSTSSVWRILRILRAKKWVWFLDGVSRSIMIGGSNESRK